MEETLVGLFHSEVSIKFALCGPGEDREEYFSGLRYLERDDFMRDLGCVENVDSVYAWAQLMFLPSWTEVQPLVVLEAAKWGIPTTLPNLEHLRDGFEDLEVQPIYFRPSDSADAVRSIEEVAFARAITSQNSVI